MNPFLIPAALVLGLIACAVAMMLKSRQRAAVLRARGLYPENGKETDADVRRLLHVGEKIMAIRCYRAAHDVGLREAKEAVERLEHESGSSVT